MANAEENELIVAVAIEFRPGCYAVMPKPNRHHNIISELHGHTGRPVGGNQTQGFFTNTGRFVGRKEACDIASMAGQIVKKTGPSDTLFSEDLW